MNNKKEEKEELVRLLIAAGIRMFPHNIADYLLENGVTIRETEWVNVKDGLPPFETAPKKIDTHHRSKSVRVLCACKQRSGSSFVKEGFCEIWNGEPVWRIPGSIDEVTHWMPLPELPDILEKGEK